MKRTVLLACALAGLGHYVDASAWTVGPWRLGSSANDALRLDVTDRHVQAYRGASREVSFSLTVGEQGLRLVSGTAPELCNAELWITTEATDVDHDGVLELDEGDRLRIYLSATLHGDLERSFVAGVAVDAHGQPRLLWSIDASTLPSLGQLAVAPTLLSLRASPTSGDLRRLLLFGSGWPVRDGPAAAALMALDADTGAVVATTFSPGGAVAGGITAIDTDADETTDQLFLADARNRVWRLRPSLASSATGPLSLRPELLADLDTAVGVDAVLLQPPDVAATRDEAGQTLLALTLGTSDRSGPRRATRHWLFHFRVPLHVPPRAVLTRADLPVVDTGPNAVALPSTAAGFRWPITGPLSSAPLTVAGRLVVATSASSPQRACPVTEVAAASSAVVVTAMEWHGHDVPREWSTRAVVAEVGAPLRASWRDEEFAPTAGLQCRVGDTAIDACPAAPRLQREYWLRGDAP